MNCSCLFHANDQKVALTGELLIGNALMYVVSVVLNMEQQEKCSCGY